MNTGLRKKQHVLTNKQAHTIFATQSMSGNQLVIQRCTITANHQRPHPNCEVETCHVSPNYLRLHPYKITVTNSCPTAQWPPSMQKQHVHFNVSKGASSLDVKASATLLSSKHAVAVLECLLFSVC